MAVRPRGALITISGTRLSDGIVNGDTVPRPVDLQGTSVVLGDTPLPLLYTAPDQTTCMIPYGVTANMTHSMIVRRGRRQSAVQSVSVAEAQPAIFTTSGTGKGQGHIYNASRNSALRTPTRLPWPVTCW